MTDARDDLLSLSFNITVMGLILVGVTMFTVGYIDVSTVVTTCCFLASMFVWKMLWMPNHHRLMRYSLWRIAALLICGGFSWWLIYQAETVRTSWYRTHVLQQRVQQLVRQAPCYFFTSDEGGIITAVSNNISFLCGYAPEELMGQHLTILMRDAPAARHEVAFQGAVRALRTDNLPNAGWMLQGLLTVGVKHKDGHIVPVRIYAGGIRWSTDIQFRGDIDMFAVMVPVPADEATDPPSTIKDDANESVKEAPNPPPVDTLAPSPSTPPIEPQPQPQPQPQLQPQLPPPTAINPSTNTILHGIVP